MRRGGGVRRGIWRVGAALAVLVSTLLVPTTGGALAEPVPRSVTISKTTDLFHDDVLTISWRGFTPGAEVYIHQCASSPTSWADCAEASRLVARTDAAGTGTASYRVSTGDLPLWNSATPHPTLRCEATSCSITVSECGFDLAPVVTRVTPITISSDPAAFPPPPPPDEDGFPTQVVVNPPVPPIVDPPAVVVEPLRAPITLPGVIGGGASGAAHLMKRWQAAAAQPPASVDVGFIPTNSPTGVEQFVSGQSEFAVTTDALTAAQVEELRRAGRGFAYAPVATSGLAVLFNMFVSSIRQTTLNLDADHLAQIYEGGDKALNQPGIVAINNGCSFQAAASPQALGIFRTDRSSATRLFTRYLSGNSTSWSAGEVDQLASADTTTGRTGSDGVAEKIAFDSKDDKTGFRQVLPQPEGTVPVAYADVSQATLRQLTTAGIENAAGSFVRPTPDALAAAFAGATVDGDGLVRLPSRTNADQADPDARSAYPIPIVYYLVVPTNAAGGFTPAMGDTLRAFLTYAVSDAGQSQAVALGMTPMPAKLRAASLATAQRLPTAPPTATTTTTTTTTAAVAAPTGGTASGGSPEDPSTADAATTTTVAGTAAPPSVESARGNGSAGSPGTGTGAVPGPRRSRAGGSQSAAGSPATAPAPPPEPAANRPGPFDDLLRAPAALLGGAGFVPTLRGLFALGVISLVAARLGRRRLTRP